MLELVALQEVSLLSLLLTIRPLQPALVGRLVLLLRRDL
jgi:hypothetical protein